MNGWTLSPALGWPIGGALAAAMTALAVAGVVLFVRRRRDSDQTVGSCVRRALLCLTVAAMALTPSMTTNTMSRAVNATDVVLAVDVTGSMAVRDAAYGSDETISRLEAAKQAVRDIVELYPDASFAGLRFGASGTLDVPLTPDELAIGNWADTLATEPTSVSAGSSLDAPLDQLLLTLKSIRASHPDDALIVYVITDGEQTSTRTRRTFSSLRRYVDDAFAVGVGSAEGGRIPVTSDGLDSNGDSDGDDSADGQWVTDPATGQPGVSKMDEQTLTDLADEMSGSVLLLDADSTMRDGASAEASRRWRVTTTAKPRERVTPVVWPLAALAVMLLAWEVAALAAASRRLL